MEALKNKDMGFFDYLLEEFSTDSDGAFTGCIGIVDGMAMKIKYPTFLETIKNPGAAYIFML